MNRKRILTAFVIVVYTTICYISFTVVRPYNSRDLLTVRQIILEDKNNFRYRIRYDVNKDGDITPSDFVIIKNRMIEAMSNED